MRKLAVVLLFLAASAAHAQSVRDVVRAFSKLQARIEVSVGYDDYTAALGDVNFQFKEFAEGPEAARYAEVKANLAAALSRYVEAAILWQTAISSGSGAIYPVAAIKIVTARFPQTAKREEDGGATIGSGGLRASLVLPLYWRDAAINIRAAKAALPPAK